MKKSKINPYVVLLSAVVLSTSVNLLYYFRLCDKLFSSAAFLLTMFASIYYASQRKNLDMSAPRSLRILTLVLSAFWFLSYLLALFS